MIGLVYKTIGTQLVRCESIKARKSVPRNGIMRSDPCIDNHIDELVFSLGRITVYRRLRSTVRDRL